MTAPKLTRPQRNALETLAHAHPHWCWISTETRRSSVIGVDNRVYWQTARSLIEAGYARTTTGQPGCKTLHLTDAGLALCRELNVVVGR